jgi:hypothetical protein
LHFRITAESVELVDPQDTRSFSVLCPADLGDDDLAAVVARAGLGEVLPGGEHLMVPVDTVRKMAAGRVGPDWPDDLSAMLDYAAGKGWASADGTRIRAHIERR